MIGELGLPGAAAYSVIALLIFGPSKLASVGKGLIGAAIRNFKSVVSGPENPRTSQKKIGVRDER